MQLTQSQIEEINAKYPDGEQGIFLQPYGIPVEIKEHVIYERWETGGMRGGGYHDGDYKHPYKTGSTPTFDVLYETLKILKPEITGEQYEDVMGFVKDGDSYDDSEDYYGNCEWWSTMYLPLSELYKFLETL